MTKAKKQTLNTEEKRWDDLYKKGSLTRVKNFSQFAETLKNASKNTDRQSKAITLRVSEKTLQRFKARAAEEGLPYQTAISMLMHKWGEK